MALDNFIGETQLAVVGQVTSSQINATQQYLAQLTQAAQAIIPPTIAIPPTNLDAPDLAELDAEKPNTEFGIDYGYASPTAPSASFDVVEFPAFTLTAPQILAVDIPGFTMGEAPVAPGIGGVALPSEPSVVLPQAPALLSLSVAGFNGITIPEFDGGDLPTLTLIEPSVTPYTPGEQYTSALLTALSTELHRRITDGGTGLNADVEQAIYDRARERELKALQEAIEGLERMESMGFAMPPGVYMDSRIKIETEFGKTTAGLSREIMIKQAELELSNVQEALKTATQLEAQMLDYANKVEQRMFETAKYTTEAGVQIYNAKVEAYKSLLEAYRTKVTIYEAVIRGEIAKVEAYKAQIAAEQAKAEINTALVNQYKVAADVAMVNVEVYRAKVQAAQISAQIEQTKVAMYGEQVRAYATKASAYSALMEGYKTRMQVESVKQDAYRTAVEAYRAQVEAAAKQADVAVEQYKADVARYAAEWDGVRAKASLVAAEGQVRSAIISAEADVYRADAQAVASANEVLVKRYEVAVREAQGAAEVAIAQAKMTGELSISSRQLILEASKVAAQVSAQLGAAALNAYNWSNSISSSEAFTYSTSTSTSTSTNTNYNL